MRGHHRIVDEAAGRIAWHLTPLELDGVSETPVLPLREDAQWRGRSVDDRLNLGRHVDSGLLLRRLFLCTVEGIEPAQVVVRQNPDADYNQNKCGE